MCCQVPDPATGKLYSSADLEVNVTENSTYTCKARNIVRSGATSDTATDTVLYYSKSIPAFVCTYTGKARNIVRSGATSDTATDTVL